MLRRVVVPWNVIISINRKKFLSIFLESFFIADATSLRYKICCLQTNGYNLPTDRSCFFMKLHSSLNIHEWFQQSVQTKDAKPLATDLSSSLNGSRKRSLINIPHQVNETLLLRTLDRIVDTGNNTKITLKFLQDILDPRTVVSFLSRSKLHLPDLLGPRHKHLGH